MSLKLRINLGTRTLGKCAFITLAKYNVLRQVEKCNKYIVDVRN